MLQKTFHLVILLFIGVIVSACGINTGANGEYPYGHYEDDRMIGTVSEIGEDRTSIIVDISEWEKRDRKGPSMTDEGYSYIANLSEETRITYEDGTEAHIDDVKKGQKVLVNPPRGTGFEGHPDEIILLEMSYEEKYSRFLSHMDGVNIVVMYENGEKLPMEMQDPLYENVSNILEGTGHSAVAAWIEYDKNYVVDYKEELDLDRFPAILVYDQKELLFKAYNVDDLYRFLENMNE
ncbi:hypothetical protein [Planomicrobium sp. CPCC 101110]|uniref:hypothetical protein n=1 Tax=Planomicrobium sp. CPCC 101110 TaxID=2599619 RepID=UPI0011B5DCAB|nr:hypothetical protein [Planomicrobium sp. CPCC 101110]TWT27077.1 hypothetical protein FQV30_00730 [Planomicrobium sp. CPCC 101110]